MPNETTNSGNWTSMGNCCINPCGKFDINTMYNFLDMVSMDGGSYICMQDQTIGVSPVRNETTDRWFCSAIPGSADEEFMMLYNTIKENVKRAEGAATSASESQRKVANDLDESTKVKEAIQQIADDVEKEKDVIAGYSKTASTASETASKSAQTATQAVQGFSATVDAETQQACTEIDAFAKQVEASISENLSEEKTNIVNHAVAETEKVINARKQEVNETGAAEILKVQNAGADQAENVKTVGAEQISALNAAGGTIESAVERYYAMQRGKEIYTVEVLDSSVSQACTVNRLDGLEGLTCEPSTNTHKGVDEIGALDAFRPILCNWTLDDAGNQHITAIQGMQHYTEDGPVNVGVLNMGLYYKKERNAADNGTLHHWSMLPRVDEGYKPMKECVRPDGTVQGWMLHPRGALVDVNGVPYGCNGNPKRKTISFASYSYPRKQGAAYCYETDVDAAWVTALTMIKYGTRNIQDFMKGCTSYSSQYMVAYPESDVKRVVLTKSQAAYFVIGSCVSVGNPGDNENLDRYYDYMHNIADSVLVTGIEEIDDTYSAIVLDVKEPFTTTERTYVSTMHWRSGSTSKVLGYDGSPVSNTDGKNICKINEIEIMPGGYSVCGNAMNIMEANSEGVTTCKYYKTDSALNLTTNIDTVLQTWKEVGEIPITDNTWKYIMEQELDLSEGIMYPTLFAGGDKTGWADGYHTGSNPTAGQKTARELLRRGPLSYVSVAGVSFVLGSNGLATALWFILSALSPNAVRGEWTV